MNRFLEDHIEHIEFGDKVRRKIHIWAPDNPQRIFVAVHGGMAHGGDFVMPGRHFRELGYATVSMDLRGHGEKKRVYIPSFEVFLDDLEIMIEWTRSRFPQKPMFMIGHSMGALILTHYGLRRLTDTETHIKGFVLSSPYYSNVIKVPKIMQQLSGILSAVAPKANLPIEDFTDFLTHDINITARHHADAADNLRARQASIRFGSELLKAQNFIPDHIANWRHPLLVFIAGQDRLANAIESEQLLKKIDPGLVTMHLYPNNYHENFNETNRQDIFRLIHDWINDKLSA